MGFIHRNARSQDSSEGSQCACVCLPKESSLLLSRSASSCLLPAWEILALLFRGILFPCYFSACLFQVFFFFCFLPCSLLFRTFGWVAVQRAKCCQMFAAFPVVYGALSLQSFGLLTFSTCQ